MAAFNFLITSATGLHYHCIFFASALPQRLSGEKWVEGPCLGFAEADRRSHRGTDGSQTRR
jgi:hypothetical protein